jgi:phage gp45-like
MGIKDFWKIIMPLANKIKLIFSKGRVISVNNTGAKGLKPSPTAKNPQRLYISSLGDEFLSQVERTQEYGLETYPYADAIHFGGCMGGRRDRCVVFSVQDPRYRPLDLTEGNVCLYDKDTARVTLRAGKVAIGNKTSNIELIDLVDQLLTLLQGNVDAVGIASTGTNSLINAQLATLQTSLQSIKGTL